ncbi:hypothetical protein [Caballeronia sp. AZ10_KS36]|uniref:hypothetical protein n=1 Tax=Caballeronia sp. AZ10_KS36 TaxID=2921757 RepID=UPI002027980E|nr:hypothetical protein [Caballeronia sp. AZ10_KS36]
MKLVGVNEKGIRVGQYHQRAKLTDLDVEQVRELRVSGLSYRAIAEKFEIGIRTVRDIVSYRKRAQFPAKWKSIA